MTGSNNVYGQIWRVGFTDILCLMVAFFILICSVSTPTTNDDTPVIATTTDMLGGQWQSPDTPVAGNIDPAARHIDLDYLSAILARQLQIDDNGIKIKQMPDHLTLTLPDELLFQSGQASVKEQGKSILFTLADILAGKDNPVEVRGHSDPRPLSKNADYANNWTLSLARADRVAGFLTRHGYTQPIIRRGMAAGQYDKIDRNLPRQERLVAARRVDILIYP